MGKEKSDTLTSVQAHHKADKTHDRRALARDMLGDHDTCQLTVGSGQGTRHQGRVS